MPKRKRHMIEAEKFMLLMYSVYYNSTGEIVNTSKIKNAITRARNFALESINNAICSRLEITNNSKARTHPNWNNARAEVFKEIEENVNDFWVRQQNS